MLSNLWLLLLVPGLPLGVLYTWIYCFRKKREKRWKKPFVQMRRPAGWSLQEKVEALQDNLQTNLMLVMIIGLSAWGFGVALGSLATTLVVGFLFTGFFCWRTAAAARHLANYRLGMRGEQVVGQELDHLSTQEIRAFHDYEVKEPGKKPWNIDHILVTPAVIFAIETKTRRKPAATADDAAHKLMFDGTRLIFPPPLKPDFSSVEQARRNARWLEAKLSELNGVRIPVEPVLTLPGWWIDSAAKQSDVHIINPKRLHELYRDRPRSHTRERLKALCAQLREKCQIEC